MPSASSRRARPDDVGPNGFGIDAAVSLGLLGEALSATPSTIIALKAMAAVPADLRRPVVVVDIMKSPSLNLCIWRVSPRRLDFGATLSVRTACTKFKIVANEPSPASVAFLPRVSFRSLPGP